MGAVIWNIIINLPSIIKNRFIGGVGVKKGLVFVMALMLSFSILGCSAGGNGAGTEKEEDDRQTSEQVSQSEEGAVKGIVEGFGSKLQLVSLQADKETVKKSMEENYGEFVTPGTLAQWANDPVNAPGRLVSSPWPDRIEIQSVEKVAQTEYRVKGQIIEITSVEKEKGGAAAKREITLLVKKTDGRWLIDRVDLGAYEGEASTVYKNSRYGFQFPLPASWEGYTIVEEKWEGLSIGDPQGDKVVETGPMISIRHPKWTKENPRQDIPIMVFTLAQWTSLEKEGFHIGAAPIGPKELGRNAKYVFALPARYNYAFPAGFEEVEEILKNDPLKPTEAENK